MTLDLWPCPDCGRRFANRRQSHSCGRWPLERHFEGREPVVREIFEAFKAAIEAIGPVTVLPEKTRIAFQARMSFAQLTTRNAHVTGHLVLARRAEGSVFTKVESFSPRNHAHHFRLDGPDEVARLGEYLREAFGVGRQEHLRPARGIRVIPAKAGTSGGSSRRDPALRRGDVD